MKNSVVRTAVLFFFLLGCMPQEKQKTELKNSEKYQMIETAQWLIGNWQNQSAKGLLTETWRKLDDSTMVGQSYFIAGADTLFLENIRLEQRKDILTYIPIVRDQNNGQAVYFTLTRSTDSVLVFENPEHDFPQKITYSIMANDSLIAEVSAVVDGKVKSQSFRLGLTASVP
ncbi:MAG TPA: DUF6265 family protein [Prolixibacteraceae bacterium]|nr:DUF6265 family protein [Prolixibacteraceae bacterium]